MQPIGSARIRRAIYIIGAVSILIAILIFRRNLAAEMHISNGFGVWQVPDPLPASAHAWFDLIQSHPLLAFILLDGVDVINAFLLIPLFMALFLANKDDFPQLSVIAFAICSLGVLTYIIANRAVPISVLAGSYRAASTRSLQAQILIHTDSLLSNPLRDTAMAAGLIFILAAGFLFSIMIYKGKTFKRSIAWMGLIANGLYLLNYPLVVFLPQRNWLLPTLSAPFRLVWYALLAAALLKKSKSMSPGFLQEQA